MPPTHVLDALVAAAGLHQPPNPCTAVTRCGDFELEDAACYLVATMTDGIVTINTVGDLCLDRDGLVLLTQKLAGMEDDDLVPFGVPDPIVTLQLFVSDQGVVFREWR